MPPLPKHPSTRARRNKATTGRTLQAVPGLDVPPLPGDEAGIDWHPMCRAWWHDIWKSPMAPEFEQSDVHGLYALAVLVNAFWFEPSQSLAAEIRLQRQCFGLSPIDRRRLTWEIDRAEAASETTTARRQSKAPAAAVPLPGRTTKKTPDPRTLLN